MIKLKSLIEESHLIPRRSKDDRLRNYSISIQKYLKRYINEGCKGDLVLEDIDSRVELMLPNNLIHVGGDFKLKNVNIKFLPDNLTKVNGAMIIQGTTLENLNNIKYIGKHLNIRKGTYLEKLSNDLHVKEGILIRSTKISELPKNLNCRSLNLIESHITELRGDIHVSKYIDMRYSKLKYISKDFTVPSISIYGTTLLNDIIQKHFPNGYKYRELAYVLQKKYPNINHIDFT